MRLVRPLAHEREDDDGLVGHKDALIYGEEQAVDVVDRSTADCSDGGRSWY